jgi:hypothetical protein
MQQKTGRGRALAPVALQQEQAPIVQAAPVGDGGIAPGCGATNKHLNFIHIDFSPLNPPLNRRI